ncbi:MAG: hypothetical protein AAF108_01120 [Planctomycetota bacterium]
MRRPNLDCAACERTVTRRNGSGLWNSLLVSFSPIIGPVDKPSG